MPDEMSDQDYAHKLVPDTGERFMFVGDDTRPWPVARVVLVDRDGKHFTKPEPDVCVTSELLADVWGAAVIEKAWEEFLWTVLADQAPPFRKRHAR